MQRSSNILRLSPSLALLTILLAGIFSVANGQDPDTRRRINPYAPSPAGRQASSQASVSRPSANAQVAFVMQPDGGPGRTDQAVLPLQPHVAETKPLPPTETYKIGVNDVLHIKLKNVSSGSDYFTVRGDGTIDFPLAGGNVRVEGRTVGEVATALARSIKLFSDPKVDVKVREYASHKVTVLGSVRNPGEKSLQREAVPLYVIKAEAVMTPETETLRISSKDNANAATYDLRDPDTDNILVFPGSTLEFIAAVPKAVIGAYFVTGKKMAAGEKVLVKGLTLLQAAIAANPTNGELKKAIIRRRSQNGILSNLEFDLRSIKSGKIADPTILAGDIIEIKG